MQLLSNCLLLKETTNVVLDAAESKTHLPVYSVFTVFFLLFKMLLSKLLTSLMNCIIEQLSWKRKQLVTSTSNFLRFFELKISYNWSLTRTPSAPFSPRGPGGPLTPWSPLGPMSPLKPVRPSAPWFEETKKFMKFVWLNGCEEIRRLKKLPLRNIRYLVQNSICSTTAVTIQFVQRLLKDQLKE